MRVSWLAAPWWALRNAASLDCRDGERAVAGARARGNITTPNITMAMQIGAHLQRPGGGASSDSPYAIDFGGGDVRDARVVALRRRRSDPARRRCAAERLRQPVDSVLRRGAPLPRPESASTCSPRPTKSAAAVRRTDWSMSRIRASGRVSRRIPARTPTSSSSGTASIRRVQCTPSWRAWWLPVRDDRTR